MRLTLLRNATLVLDVGGVRLLVDPMLSAARRLPPLAVLRQSPRRNPLVDLPANSAGLLSDVHACLISHFRYGHFDHLDGPGRAFLRARGIPVYCQQRDVSPLAAAGLRAIGIGEAPTRFFSGSIRTVAALHGRGMVGRMMGCGVGFVIRFPGEPSLYLSGDTVLSPAVTETLEREKPMVAVVHAGGAQLDVGEPILMPIPEVRRFAELAPRDVVAIHLEALNHCPSTRTQIRELAQHPRVGRRLHVPDDGETLEFRDGSGAEPA